MQTRGLAAPSGADALGHKGSGSKQQVTEGVRKRPLMCHQPVTFETMCSVEVLSEAVRAIKADIPARQMALRARLDSINLQDLSDRLRSGQYRHRVCSLRRRRTGDKWRSIDSPDLIDKVVQRAYVDTIMAVVESVSNESCHGFRPDRSIHTGLWRLIREIEQSGYTHIFRTDIEGFFDNIPHSHMAAAIYRNITDPKLREFSLELLSLAKTFKGANVGLPTGWLVNPLWANLLLSPLDDLLASAGLCFIRYADDYAILQRSRKETRQNKFILEAGLRDLGLGLKDGLSGKTYTRHLRGGVVVLGHELKMVDKQLTVIVSKGSLEKVERLLYGRVRKMQTCHDLDSPGEDILLEANGWSGNAVLYPNDWHHSRLRELESVNAKLSKMIDALSPARHDLLNGELAYTHIKKKPLLTIRPLADMRLIKAPAA